LVLLLYFLEGRYFVCKTKHDLPNRRFFVDFEVIIMDQNLGRGITQEVVDTTRQTPTFEELMRRKQDLLASVRENGGGIVDTPEHRLFGNLMPSHQEAVLNGRKVIVDVGGKAIEI
jgi:hypothetical protein